MTTSSVSPWIGLAGVAIGFALGEGSRYARYRWETARNRRIVRTELESVIAQLPQKRDILQQAIAHMNEKRFMPTLSVRMVATGYYSVLEDMYPHLKPLQRNCLHVIFERIRVADEQLDKFEQSFVAAMKDKVITDPWITFCGRLEELLESYAVVEALSRSYLANKPIDVFSVNNRHDG
jgi:hypothetical protein